MIFFGKGTKGSFEIGINFLVIMIIALVVLALIVYFLVSGFNFSQGKFSESSGIATSGVMFPATPDRPVVFQADTYELKLGEPLAAVVSVYNKGFDSTRPLTLALADCMNSDSYKEQGITISASPQTIMDGKSKGYRVILKASTDVALGSYVCTVISGYEDGSGSVDKENIYNSAQISVDVIN